MLNKVKWALIKLKITTNLLTEVTTSPDASLSGSSAPLAQLAYITIYKSQVGEFFNLSKNKFPSW